MANFNVDTANNDDETFYVDVEGIGTVIIKVEDKGISTYIYPLHVVDKEIDSAFAPMDKLIVIEE